MANKKTVRLNTLWADAQGGIISLSTSVERSESGNEVDLATITNRASAIVAAIDALSDCKFLGAEIEIPIQAQLTLPKTAPTNDSRARRHAVTRFLAEAGENLRTEIVSIGVPDPLDSKLVVENGDQRLNVSDADVVDYIQQVVAKCLTIGGENLSAYLDSYVRQKPTGRNSRQ